MEVQSLHKFNEISNKIDNHFANQNEVTFNQQHRFENVFHSLLEMKDRQDEAKTQMLNVSLEGGENATKSLIQLEKINLEMQMASSVRDKMVNGLNNLLNMQI